MAFIPAPNTVRVCIQFEWTGQTVEICLAFLRNTTVTTSDMDDLLDQVETWRVDSVIPHQSEDIVSTQYLATLLTTATSPSFTRSISANQAGTVASASVPNNVALVTTFQTALRGRSYRGRAYFPGIPRVNLQDSVTIEPAEAADINAEWALLPTALSADWQHVVVSYQNNNAMRSTAARTPVIAYRTEQYLDSQRRRLANRGA